MNTNLSGLLLLAKALSLPDDQPLPNDPMDLLRVNTRSSNASPNRSTRDSNRGIARGGATRGNGDA